jgi:hypothetical protein
MIARFVVCGSDTVSDHGTLNGAMYAKSSLANVSHTLVQSPAASVAPSLPP